MQSVVELLKGLQLHPYVDHFTVSLVLVAILFDLVASLLPSRTWLRYTALTLLILGAASAAGSKVTGGFSGGGPAPNPGSFHFHVRFDA